MRRRTLLVALVGLAVVAAAGAVVFWPRPDRITLENYRRVRPGMARADVEAILGPAGDYASGPVWEFEWVGDSSYPLGFFTEHAGWGHNGRWGQWEGDRGTVGVYFNASGTVNFAGFVTAEPVAGQGPLANLLWRANRQWHRWFPG